MHAAHNTIYPFLLQLSGTCSEMMSENACAWNRYVSGFLPNAPPAISGTQYLSGINNIWVLVIFNSMPIIAFIPFIPDALAFYEIFTIDRQLAINFNTPL